MLAWEQQDQIEEALHIARDHLRRFPKSDSALVRFVRLARRAGHHAEVGRVLQQRIGVEPKAKLAMRCPPML